MAGEVPITRLLAELRAGDREAIDRLFPLVYDELHALARRQVRRMGPGQTLDTTELLHEAYLKLSARTREGIRDRGHFMAVAATIMRHLLIDHARQKAALKRGGGLRPATLDGLIGLVPAEAEELLALDQALEALASVDDRLVSLVEMRFFGGLTESEIGAVLEVSERTVKRDWRKARALLFRMVAPEPVA